MDFDAFPISSKSEADSPVTAETNGFFRRSARAIFSLKEALEEVDFSMLGGNGGGRD